MPRRQITPRNLQGTRQRKTVSAEELRRQRRKRIGYWVGTVPGGYGCSYGGGWRTAASHRGGLVCRTEKRNLILTWSCVTQRKLLCCCCKGPTHFNIIKMIINLASIIFWNSIFFLKKNSFRKRKQIYFFLIIKTIQSERNCSLWWSINYQLDSNFILLWIIKTKERIFTTSNVITSVRWI